MPIWRFLAYRCSYPEEVSAVCQEAKSYFGSTASLYIIKHVDQEPQGPPLSSIVPCHRRVTLPIVAFVLGLQGTVGTPFWLLGPPDVVDFVHVAARGLVSDLVVVLDCFEERRKVVLGSRTTFAFGRAFLPDVYHQCSVIL